MQTAGRVVVCMAVVAAALVLLRPQSATGAPLAQMRRCAQWRLWLLSKALATGTTAVTLNGDTCTVRLTSHALQLTVNALRAATGTDTPAAASPAGIVSRCAACRPQEPWVGLRLCLLPVADESELFLRLTLRIVCADDYGNELPAAVTVYLSPTVLHGRPYTDRILEERGGAPFVCVFAEERRSRPSTTGMTKRRPVAPSDDSFAPETALSVLARQIEEEMAWPGEVPTPTPPLPIPTVEHTFLPPGQRVEFEDRQIEAEEDRPTMSYEGGPEYIRGYDGSWVRIE